MKIPTHGVPSLFMLTLILAVPAAADASNNSLVNGAAPPIKALGNTVHLSFESLQPGNGENLIDAVTFGSQCSALLFDGVDDYVEVANVAQVNAIGSFSGPTTVVAPTALRSAGLATPLRN